MSDEFLIQDGQTVVFIGDSITDCGRRAEEAPFGNGYVRMVIDLIRARYPERTITFINEGIGGDTVVGLRDRWHDDVLVHAPDWVSVKIGINDLHRRFNPDPLSKIPLEMFREAYHQILTRTKEGTRARILLMDPFYISKETDLNSFRGQVRNVLPEYIAVVHEMAEEFQTLHVPTHEVFQELLAHYAADVFCPEPVHPYPSGHMIMAHAWLQTVGW